MPWQIVLAQTLRALSFSLIGFALLRLFRDQTTAILGKSRWVITGAIFAIAVLQILSPVFAFLGSAGLDADARLLASIILVFVAIGLKPFFRLLKIRLAAAEHHRLSRRLALAEIRAKQDHRWLELAEEMAHVGHWAISFPGNELFWSAEIFRIHGLDPSAQQPDVASAIGFFVAEDRPMIETNIATAIANKSGYEWQAALRRADGEIRHVISRGITQMNEHGEVIKLFGVFMDVTDQKRHEQVLLSAHEQVIAANERLRTLALIDSLTELPNRRQFDAVLQTEFKRAIREQAELGLIMIDLDHFKQYNDHLGHLAGDECLREVARVLASIARRPGDLVARFGGEEFIVLLPKTGFAGTDSVAHSMVEALRAAAIPHPSSPQGIVTISCGMTAYPNAGASSPRALINQADQALYRAKLAGRNGACQFPSNQTSNVTSLFANPHAS